MTTTPTEFKDLPDEIKPHVHTLRALMIAHNLLTEAPFPMAKIQDVYQSTQFLRSICEQSMRVALEIKGWELVPELVNFKASLEAPKAEEVPAEVPSV